LAVVLFGEIKVEKFDETVVNYQLLINTIFAPME
jgi:hypothetical protein